MAQKANISQVSTLLTTLLLLFISEKFKKKVLGINGDELIRLIDFEDKGALLDRFVRFFNNGCEFVIIMKEYLINFDAPPTTLTDGMSLKERIGLTGTVVFDPRQWKARKGVDEGGRHVTWNMFFKQILEDKKDVIPNSNMIYFLVVHQKDSGVKEFLKQYDRKKLIAFGDRFLCSDGTTMAVCCMIQNPEKDMQWEDRWDYMEIQDSLVPDHFRALYFETTTQS